jgi:endonuclease/exonuclease/phosphatase family metal-dependent hydrolase
MMSTAPTSDVGELRVLHWNIHSWTDESGNSNLERVAGLIMATEPDVVSLVEVNEPLTGPSPLHELASGTAYHSVFVPAFEYGTDQPRGQFGNTILSRIPLLDVRHHHLVWPPRIYSGTEPSEPRSLVLGRVQASVGPVWIGSTHLPATDHVARDAAARRALAIMSALSLPWLLVGDFNAGIVPWRMEYPSLQAYPETATPTYPANDPTECIDYCIAPRGQGIRVRALDVAGSDHLPIIVQFQSRRAPVQTGDDTTDP